MELNQHIPRVYRLTYITISILRSMGLDMPGIEAGFPGTLPIELLTYTIHYYILLYTMTI